ncbi:hypothetical protein CRG98_003505 [Punica granatum]|uniref:Zinc finger PHD-type domain-containing protein n=1 Tax=Punica granatum TaxID=22663 RepID=A0A2I0L626_PUNGR|nr:hypothetical protein CRG98_003505 [Punica granatum]
METRGSEEGVLLPNIEGVRYIFHREHEHQLILAELDGWEGMCRSCRKSTSGLTYSCSRCGFYLHKRCTGNPDVIESPLHPHPLTRDFCTGSRCSSCRSTSISKSNFYKCLKCDFSLDQKCALADIQHPSHPFHRLTRIELREFKCHNCLEYWYGTLYRCEECDFDLDFKCAFLVAREEFEGKEPVLSDIHRHPLALTDESSRRNGDCIVCYEPCSLSTYSCRACSIYVNVHKSCATTKIPKTLHHTLLQDSSLQRCHSSSHHTLFLDDHLQRSRGSFTCRACQKDCSGLCYEIPGVDYKLDVRCAYLDKPLIIFDGHSHPLIFLEVFDGHGTCNVCDKPCTSSIFHCPTCNIQLHLFCGPLPCSIKQETHTDILDLKDSLVEDLTGYDEFYCDSCEEQRDPHECVYYCSRCHYCADIKCVMHELKLVLSGKSGDVALRTLGRWSRSGKVLSKGLLSEEMQKYGIGTASMDTKPACCMKDIIESLPKDDKIELDNIFNSSEKLFEDLSGDDSIQDARPYSDEEFIQLVQKLDSAELRGLKRSWKSNIRFIRIGEFLVPQQLIHVYNDLYQKYGDLTAETKLSVSLKALMLLPLCQAVEGLCSTKVIDITESDLMDWCICVKAVHRAGFKIQFIVDALKVVVRAYYGLLFQRNIGQEIRSLEEEIPMNKESLGELEGQLKHHKEYFESKEPSLVKECMEEASLLMYKTAGEVVLE